MSNDKMNAEREAFWTALSEAAPELGIEPGPGQEKEIALSSDGRVRVKFSLSQDKTSVYLVARSENAEAWVNGNLELLAKGLRTTVGDATGEAAHGRWFRKDNNQSVVTVRRHWPEAIRWLRAQHQTFKAAVKAIESG